MEDRQQTSESERLLRRYLPRTASVEAAASSGLGDASAGFPSSTELASRLLSTTSPNKRVKEEELAVESSSCASAPTIKVASPLSSMVTAPSPTADSSSESVEVKKASPGVFPLLESPSRDSPPSRSVVGSTSSLSSAMVPSTIDSSKPIVQAFHSESFASQAPRKDEQRKAKPLKSHTHVLNARILREWEKLMEAMPKDTVRTKKGTPNDFRLKAYSRQYDTLKNLKFEITSSEQIRGLPGFMGPDNHGVAKVAEILETGGLTKARALSSDARIKSFNELRKVWGVGPVMANKLIDFGITSVAQLRKAVSEGLVELDARQVDGLKYVDDLTRRIPREEMEEIRDFLVAVARHVYPNSPKLVAEVTGSFRRGATSSQDVDFLITDPDIPDHPLPLRPLVTRLTELGFVVSNPNFDLSTPEDADEVTAPLYEVAGPEGARPESFLGMCRLPPRAPGETRLVRRLDIKSFPGHNFAFAKLIWTGPTVFNREMALVAKSKGMTLSTKGLFRYAKDDPVDSRGAPIHCATEEEIFKILGVPYRPPEQRSGVLRWPDRDAG